MVFCIHRYLCAYLNMFRNAMSTSTPPGRFFVIYVIRLFNKKAWRNLSNQNFEPELVQKQFILITIT